VCQQENTFYRKRPHSRVREHIPAQRCMSAKEACIHSKRGLHTQQKRPVYTAREVCIHSKRGLYTQQKRPVYTAKEACIHSKRGLHTQQKRPIYTAKEAYIHSKRGLHTAKEAYTQQKRPTHSKPAGALRDTEVEEATVVGLVRVAHHERHIIKCFMSHHQMHDVTSSNA
jgi:uncharacterized Fe-S cluster protein YjdI